MMNRFSIEEKMLVIMVVLFTIIGLVLYFSPELSLLYDSILSYIINY